MVDGKIRQALETMPKSELHLHIEGTLEPELALTLADRNGVTLPWTDIDGLRAQYEFENLQSFLELYYALMKTLKTKDDFKDLMLAYLTRANANGVRHAEIFFDPQVHVCTNGLDFDMVLDGLLEGLEIGRERFDISGGLILSIVRDMDIDSANRILDMAAPRKTEILGIGLDSAEVGYPPAEFIDQFARARDFGWHCVAHAGEEGPAAYIRDALNLLHAERIDHGIHIQDDRELLERVARDGVPLTCCPLSNLRLQVVHDMREHPIPRFLRSTRMTPHISEAMPRRTMPRSPTSVCRWRNWHRSPRTPSTHRSPRMTARHSSMRSLPHGGHNMGSNHSATSTSMNNRM